MDNQTITTTVPVRRAADATPAKSAEVCAFDPKADPQGAELEQKAIDAHRAVQEAAGTALTKAHEAGKALTALKEKVGHGQWEAYCVDVLGINKRTAQVYMRVARNWLQIEKAGAESLTTAIASLRKPEDTEQRLTHKPSPAEKLVSYAEDAHDTLAAIVAHVTDLSKAPRQRKKLVEHVEQIKSLLSQLEAALGNGGVQ